MKSKKILFWFVIITIFLLINIEACNSILQEHPKSFVTSNNFYKSKNQFNSAIIGLYGDLESMVNNYDSFQLYELFAAYIAKPPPGDTEENITLWENNPLNTTWNDKHAWQLPYKLISDANWILISLKSANLDKNISTKIAAETKCLRAYAYFDLVQLFGALPLRRKPVKNLEEVQLKRSTPSAVYELIIQDLKDAIAGLPTKSIEGRVNKWVAKALLAQVYLTTAGNPLNKTNNYKLALKYSLDIINNGPYSLVKDYANEFKNKRYTTGDIWAVLFKKDVTSNSLFSITAPEGFEKAYLRPTKAFMNSFLPGDQRRVWGIKSNYKGPKGNILMEGTYFNKFIDTSLVNSKQPVASVYCDYERPLIRLSEIYLIAAEAEDEVNGPGAAYKYINKVRWRARINKNDPKDVPDLKGLTKKQLLKAIHKEWRWEFYGEGFAWFNLKRTNSFDLVQKARGSQLAVPIGPYNKTWPIPKFEILNNNITQNPAYGK
jgi:hypothetical protein